MTTSLTLVVAMDARRGIGVDNTLPWRLPEDLAHFKRVTLGHPIIMGRKTFDSIGRPLPGRRNIVVTRNRDWAHAGVETAASLQDAIAMLGGEPASIIGGAQVFQEAMPLTERMIVTHIDHVYRCDTFFPEIDAAQWLEVAREVRHSDTANVDFAFVTYQKTQKQT